MRPDAKDFTSIKFQLEEAFVRNSLIVAALLAFFGGFGISTASQAACNECGPPVHLVPNATVLGPCPKGWSITPVRGYDYVTPWPGVILHRGQRIHVNMNGTFDPVD